MANIFSIRFADEFEKELYRLSKKYRNIPEVLNVQKSPRKSSIIDSIKS